MEDERMGHYIYNGAVLNIGNVISNKWKGETYAVSEKKAVSNLCYQFKKQYGYSKSAKISLYDKPKAV